MTRICCTLRTCRGKDNGLSKKKRQGGCLRSLVKVVVELVGVGLVVDGFTNEKKCR